MARKFHYTTLAHRYTARFPMLTYVGTQTNFWILANILLVSILHLQSRVMAQVFNISTQQGFGPMLLIAVGLGVVYGICLGLTGYYLDRTLFRNFPLGKVIILKAIVSLVVVSLLLALVRYVLFDRFISSSLELSEHSWRMLFYLLFIYYAVMTLVIGFVNQVNKKYGPGVLLPLLLGRYRTPREEERIFMFMDLKSSTTTAERLGHLRYSAFIRDCFSDINAILYPYRAQVYQYVGDEIVVTWQESEGLKDHFCIRFYFACQKQFLKRKDYYITNYGVMPEFKAGIHTGLVTAVEIGEVKRDIAYHGDTLNTTARIQSVCNEYHRSFIGSEDIVKKAGPHPSMTTEALGMIYLKGKTVESALVGIGWTNDNEL